MKTKKYSSKIEFEESDNSLTVEVKYEKVVSKEEEEQFRDYFHWRAKQRSDRAKKKDIQVSPREGDVVEETTTFGVWSGRKLYAGLERVKSLAPYVFPLLIEDLRRYAKENLDKKELVDYAIKGLEELLMR